MKIVAPVACAVAFVLTVTMPAQAGEYTCKGNRVEKSGSTKYKVRRSGSTIYIEKSGSTRGKAVQRGKKYSVEVSGSTKATIKNGKIYKSGATWAKVSDAQRIYDCDPIVAATLWVLHKVGRL